MSVSRNHLKQLIDKIDEKHLGKLSEILEEILEDDMDNELSIIEMKEIYEAEKRINNGEYISLDELNKRYKEDI